MRIRAGRRCSRDPDTAVGFFIWMIGSWLVATRFALKPFTFTPHAHRAPVRDLRPAPGARPLTGVRKARPSRQLPTPRVIQPTPSRIVV